MTRAQRLQLARDAAVRENRRPSRLARAAEALRPPGMYDGLSQYARWLRVLSVDAFDRLWAARDSAPAYQREELEIERARRLAGPRAGAGGGGCG